MVCERSWAFGEETLRHLVRAIEDDPATAENVRLCSSLMLALNRNIANASCGPRRRMTLVFRRASRNLMHGKINSLGFGLLVRMATTAGLRVSMKIRKAA